MRTLCFLIYFLAGLIAPPAHATSLTDSTGTDVDARLQQLSAAELEDVIWLARCVFSEADRPNEQRLVAWVVRNRVETGYRGNTYRDVILEAKQFSAFNSPTPRRAQILAFDRNSTNSLWRQALEISLDVYHASPAERPFSDTTRHFYSPVSMRNGATPNWALGADPVDVSPWGIDPHRFRFFDQVDTTATGSTVPSPSAIAEQIDARRESRVSIARPSVGPSGKVKRPARPSVERSGRLR